MIAGRALLLRSAIFAAALLVAPGVGSPAAGQDAATAARSGSGDRVRVCAGGDVTLGTNLDTTWTTKMSEWLRRPVPALPNPDAVLRPLRPLVSDADIVLVNVEGAIGSGPVEEPKCEPGARGCFALRQPPAAAAALRRISPRGQVVGNLANNHARDAGARGFERTVKLLERARVHVTGVDTLATPVVTRGGDTVAFLGFSTSTGPDPRDIAAVRRHVARAAARYPLLVVTMHLGAEGRSAQRTRDTMEVYFEERRGNPVAFAHAATDAGAKLVVGHGPHVVRALEWRNESLIAYSLGNLVTYGPFSLREPLNRGAILCTVLDTKRGVLHAHLRPTKQRAPGRVSSDRSSRAVILADSLARLDFPDSGAVLLTEAVVRRRE
ncbi:MAG TPA: CapA family protein [Gemmatimonadaceae bacterium]|nr:CapA family protein [Gemmatimonadaceae bacterium]